jgi:hypothetical protein
VYNSSVRAMTAMGLVVAWAAVARGEPAGTDRAWHVGANLRTELSTHAVRIDGGVRLGRLDLIAVLDPLWWTDDEVDVDALATYRVGCAGYGVLLGWRPASIGLASGRQFQETLVLGAVGPLPRIGPVELQFGVEAAVVLVKHGGGLPTDVTSFASSTEVGDNVNISMFVRIGYAHAL